MITALRLEPPLEVIASACCCPLAAGRCQAPFDLQTASLGVVPGQLTVAQQVAAVLADSVLEHLRSDLPLLAVRHAERLAGLLDLL